MGLCGHIPPPNQCGQWTCDDGGWDLIPYRQGTSCMKSGYPGTCNGDGWCVTNTLFGNVIPNFYITHVIYALPGRQSSVSYGAGNTYGSTTTLTDNFQSQTQVSVSFGIGSPIFSTTFTLSYGHDWGSTSTTMDDISLQMGVTYTKPAEGDLIDHRWDEIWVLLNPQLDVNITPAYGTKPQLLQWQFSTPQPGTTQEYGPIYVGWLLDPSTMPSDVSDRLARSGITPAYYPQLLAADPFAHGASPNPTLDPARFIPVAYISTDAVSGSILGSNAVSYLPPYGPGSPDVIRYNLTRNVTNTSTQETKSNYSAGYSVNASSGFIGLFKGSASNSNTFTWGHTSSTKTSTQTSKTDVIMIGQPNYGYNGPTILRVYEDTIWKTYFFSLDYW